MANNIQPTASIESDVTIGENTKIWDFVHIRSGAVIGSNCVLGRNVQIDSGVRVGNGCKIQNGVSVYDGVTLRDDVFVGPFAVFTNDLQPRAFNTNWKITPTLVKTGASIGANATIVCGIELGEYCMIAAGAVVTKSVEPYQLVGGVPARHMGWVDKDGNVISKNIEKPINRIAT